MTRKDYIVLAEALADVAQWNHFTGETPWQEVYIEIVRSLEGALKRDNGNFKRDAFDQACKLDDVASELLELQGA